MARQGVVREAIPQSVLTIPQIEDTQIISLTIQTIQKITLFATAIRKPNFLQCGRKAKIKVESNFFGITPGLCYFVLYFLRLKVTLLESQNVIK